jgi:zinc/manganese transport system permease protein
MNSLLAAIVEPGFFSSEPVHTAMAVGGAAALVSGIIGVITVVRGQSFAGHALADVSSAVTGVVLGAGLGLAALLIYFDVTSKSTTGAAITVMFGSMFAIPASIIPIALAVGIVALLVVAMLYRPLLLSSLDPELAAVRGVRVRMIGNLHLMSLALAVSLSAMTVGAILSTALLIGPAAIALRVAKRPGHALILAALIGTGATWAGILLAYDSYYWTPGHGWPVSFFVVALIFALYVITLGAGRSAERTPRGWIARANSQEGEA